ncbi:MAG TPA: hypothetical protein VFA89_12135 [Terriglobales bacterium]|nr:hypothetical protein [Terriglobales bacterium]
MPFSLAQRALVKPGQTLIQASPSKTRSPQAESSRSHAGNAQPSSPATTAKPATGAEPAPGQGQPSQPGNNANQPPSLSVGKQSANPKKKVVREGGTADANPQLSRSISDAQAAHERQVTEEMIGAGEANLQKLSGRQLDTNRRETAEQARVFLQQARRAMQGGDLQRAHNLALKARLLSDDLIQH